MEDINFTPKSCCSCTKENSFNFTLEDLEEKRWQLINLQKVIVGLRHVQQKKKMADAKQMRLAMKSKGKFIYPDIKINSETSKNAAHENELVRRELSIFNRDKVVENFKDKFQESESKARSFFKSTEETLYKVFGVRIGHLHGNNLSAFAIISSEALYVVDENFQTKFNEVLHENVELIVVGESERWIAFLCKDLYSKVSSQFNKEISFIQLDTGDSALTRNIIKYLEIAVRRRLISLSVAHNKPNFQVRSVKFPVNIVCASSLTQISVASRRIRFSYGRWLESLLPNVVSCSNQEVHYIENWLMEKLKIKKRPQVLACWLVFWENGSEFLYERESQTDPSPSLDGYLMVNSSWYKSWSPAYFCLKGGMLYRFNDSCDRLPHTVYKIKDFCGCRRLTTNANARPHAFELFKFDGYSMALAAPNEDTASQWLQSFLKVIGTSDDYDWGERLKMKPCQVIQTTESLILSYQHNYDAALNLKQDIDNIRKKEDSSKKSTFNTLSENQARRNSLHRMSSKGKMISKSPNPCQIQVSSSVPIHLPETNTDFHIECPPTPPLPEFPDKSSEIFSDNCNADRGKIDLQLLSFCNIDQISEIYITSWPSNGCLMEFECSEASEISGDWVLYFSSENQLSSFLTSVLKLREGLTKELVGPTKVSSGRVHDLLVEGAATSQNCWKPFSNRLH